MTNNINMNFKEVFFNLENIAINEIIQDVQDTKLWFTQQSIAKAGIGM